jgi:hypothetical protein
VNTAIRACRQDSPGCRRWDLASYEVNYIHLDYRFGFDCSGFSDRDGYLRVTINIPFCITGTDGSVVYDPEDTQAIGGALLILHKDVVDLTVHATGRLEVRFDGGIVLSVDKHVQYESWELHGEGELADIQMLCSPHNGPPWGAAA